MSTYNIELGSVFSTSEKLLCLAKKQTQKSKIRFNQLLLGNMFTENFMCLEQEP